MYQKRFRLWFEKDGRAILGDGRARLLKLIAETGSLRKAAEEMGMSYRYAWGIVREMNESAGEPLVVSRRGGTGGGSTALSPMASLMLADYEKSRKELERTLRYGRIDLAADALILFKESIVLIKRRNEPYKGVYALPGGFLGLHETVEECVIREAKEETGLDCRIEGSIGLFSSVDRDPRGRTVSAAYLLLPLSEGLSPAAGDDAMEIKLVPLSAVNKMIEEEELAFDHASIIKKFMEGN